MSTPVAEARPRRERSDVGGRLSAWLDDPAHRWAPLGIALVGAVSLSLSLLRIKAPTIFPDELGYLGVGRWLVGEGTHPALDYEPGLGFLYAPLFWVAESQSSAYRLALVLNAIMLAVAYLLLVHALRGRDEPLRRRDLLAAGTIAFVQFTWFTHVAMAPTVLLLLTVLAFWTFRRVRSTAGFAAAMFLVGLSPVFHKRALVLVAAALVAAVLGRSHGARMRSLATAGVPLSLASVIAFLAIRWNQQVPGGGSSSVVGQEVGVAEKLLERTGDVLVHLVSQASYEVLASGVFVVVGAVVAARWVRSGQEDRAAATFVLAVFAFSLLAVAARSGGGIHIRDVFWGRYLAPFALPAVALGAQHVVGLRRREPALAFGVVVCGALSALVIRYLPEALDVGYLQPISFDSPAIALFAEAVGGGTAELAAAGSVVLVLSLALAAVLSRGGSGTALVGVVVALSLLMVPTLYADLYVERSRVAINEGLPAAYLASVAEPNGCAYIDEESLLLGPGRSRRFISNYRWYFPGVVHPFGSTARCPWVLTGSPDFGEEHPMWTKVFEDPRRPAHALWKR